MTKRITTITMLILSIILVLLYVVSTTYSVIINVIDKDDHSEIINDITIRDLVTNEDGSFNNTYYDIINELNITYEEAEIIMDSVYLNEILDTLLNSIVDYSLHNKNKLSNDEIYNLLLEGIYQESKINITLQEKLIIKINEYISDISEYLYGIETVRYGTMA